MVSADAVAPFPKAGNEFWLGISYKATSLILSPSAITLPHKSSKIIDSFVIPMEVGGGGRESSAFHFSAKY